MQQSVQPVEGVSSPREMTTESEEEAAHVYSLYEYEITLRGRTSEAAKIFFARQKATGQDVVIKILREYKDTRYDLRTLQQRQQAQLEALRCNQKYTSGVYRGLAVMLSPLFDRDLLPGDVVCLSQVFGTVEEAKTHLDVEKEYALIMKVLPENQRLDNLLESGETNEISLQTILDILVQRIASLHQEYEDPDSGINDQPWGSVVQIQEKLEHNIDLLNRISKAVKDDIPYSKYYWLKPALRYVVELDQYHDYFERRLREGHIKRCHGDLKGMNIWVDIHAQNIATSVMILDAIDFNPTYSNIDELSDLAMLVVDVEVHTASFELADILIEQYLHLTKQSKDREARLVLAYYLVEKAVVRAAVSTVYDGLPELGLYFLRIAEHHMQELERLLDIPIIALYLAPIDCQDITVHKVEHLYPNDLRPSHPLSCSPSF